MKMILKHVLAGVCALGFVTATAPAADWMAGMKEGSPAFKSMTQLAFGPQGILFFADSKAATVVALATGDTTPASGSKSLKSEGVNQKIAALLGTSAEQIGLDDMAVNPISRQVYISVSRGRGPEATPVLVRIKTDGQPEVVALDKMKFSRADLPDAPAESAGSGPGPSPRQESITDLAFFQDRVL